MRRINASFRYRRFYSKQLDDFNNHDLVLSRFHSRYYTLGFSTFDFSLSQYKWKGNFCIITFPINDRFPYIPFFMSNYEHKECAKCVMCSTHEYQRTLPKMSGTQLPALNSSSLVTAAIVNAKIQSSLIFFPHICFSPIVVTDPEKHLSLD